MSRGFPPGPVRQIGFVVTDVDEAMQSWLQLGVGPWFVMRGVPARVDYRGRPCEVVQSIAMANTGDLQVELIQQADDTPSIFTEFLAEHGPGFHQIAYWAEDFDEAIRSAEGAGLPVVWSGGDENTVRFAYLEPPAGPVAIVEIMVLNDITRAMAELVRSAAQDWDGSDPVRDLKI